MYALRLLFLLSLVSLTGSQLTAQQAAWPQWGGSNRDHKSNETGLLQAWPEGGPKNVWTFSNAGYGYSSFSIVDGKLYTMGQVDGSNYVICLDSTTGEPFWRFETGAALPESAYLQGWAGGPRSTPTISGERLFATDDGGRMVCLDRATGKLHWRVNLVEDFGGEIPKWGYSASPLVDGDRVIVIPGKEQFLVALDVETGKKVMASSGYNHPAHYVSAVKHSVGGVDSYVTACEQGLVCFSATTGEVFWTNGSSGNSVATIPTPQLRDDLVYHTSDYGTGCVLVKVSENAGKLTATEVYSSKNMQNHHGGVVLLGDNVFGYKRRGGWVCQDLMTGDIKWYDRISGDSSAAIAYADKRLYVFGESTGSCYLVEPSETEWLERGKLKLPSQTSLNRLKGKIWAHPVIAEGKLFLRDMDLIFAFDIKAR